MKSCTKSVFIIFALHVMYASLFPQNATPNNISTYMQFCDQFYQIGQKPCEVADIDGLVIKRDVATFTLGKGKLYIFPPVGNKKISALFIGTGIFSFDPPSKIEKEQLLRFYEEWASSLKFYQAFFLFNDTTLSELTRNFNFTKTDDDREFRKNVDYFMDYVGDKSDDYILTNLFQCLIDQEQNGFFYAQMSESNSQPFFFEINPYEKEEVRFSHKMVTSRFITRPEIICQFPVQSKINKTELSSLPSKDIVKIESYKLDATIESDFDFYASAQVRFTVLKKNIQWLNFDIYEKMEVDSILTSENKKAEFHKSDDHRAIWIHLDKPHDKFDDVVLTFYYHSSKVMERDLDAWVYFRANHNWYPRYGTGETSLFDITYHHPDNYQLISVGDSLGSTISDGVVTSKWKTSKPIRNASFNIGYYKQETYNQNNSTVVSVLNAKAGHLSRGMMEEIAFDIVNSIKFFEHIFGPCPVDHLYISETPYFHGLAFPGLIHLSWITFESANRRGTMKFSALTRSLINGSELKWAIKLITING